MVDVISFFNDRAKVFCLLLITRSKFGTPLQFRGDSTLVGVLVKNVATSFHQIYKIQFF